MEELRPPTSPVVMRPVTCLPAGERDRWLAVQPAGLSEEAEERGEKNKPKKCRLLTDASISSSPPRSEPGLQRQSPA